MPTHPFLVSPGIIPPFNKERSSPRKEKEGAPPAVFSNIPSKRFFFQCSFWLLCIVLFGGLETSAALGETLGNIGRSIQSTQRGGDFDPASTAWNGLSLFVSEAEKLGLRVETPRVWNWRHAKLNVPILIFALRDEELEIAPLKQYIASGGRVLLADDFGAGDRLWEAFGLEGYRLATPPGEWKKQRYIDIHRTWPAPHREADFLLRQASYIFLNVPQWLVRVKGTPQSLLLSVPYRSNRPDRSMGGKVLWRVSHGYGKLVVLGDPSALINQMIVYGDNHRFARNVLQYLSIPVHAKRVMLLWGNMEWQGKMTQHPPRGAALSVSMWDAMNALNSAITPLPALYQAWPPLWQPPNATGQTLLAAHSWADTQIEIHRKYLGNSTFLIMLLVVGLLGLFARFAPFWNSTARPLFSPKELVEHHSRFEEQLESYREGSLSYLGPVILLKEELILFLAEYLGMSKQLQERDPSELGVYVLSQMEEKLKQKELPAGFATALPQLQRLIMQVPGRHQWGSVETRQVSAKSLKVYYNTAMLCLRSLGLEAEFRKSRWQSQPSAKTNAKRSLPPQTNTTKTKEAPRKVPQVPPRTR